MTPMEFEKRVARLMKLGKYTREECEQLVLDDEKVDRGEPLPWDLTKEQKANQKKAMSTGTRVQKEPTKRTKKDNPTKKSIIEEIVAMLGEDDQYTNVVVVNDERQVAFSVGEDNFEITLVQKRKKKQPKGYFLLDISAARWRMSRAEFSIIPYPTQFVKRKTAQKNFL